MTAFVDTQNYIVNPYLLDIVQAEYKNIEPELIKIFEGKNQSELGHLIENYNIAFIVCNRKEWFEFISSQNGDPVLKYNNYIIKKLN